MLKFPGTQGLFHGLPLFQEFPDGIGLVAVGDNQCPAQLTDGVINNQAGVLHFAGVIGLRANAVGLQGKNAVAAVDAAAHDEIGGHSLLSVRGQPQDNAPAGVSIGGKLLLHGTDFVNVHPLLLRILDLGAYLLGSSRQ